MPLSKILSSNKRPTKAGPGAAHVNLYYNLRIFIIIFILISKVDCNAERLSKNRWLDRGSLCKSKSRGLCGYIHKTDGLYSYIYKIRTSLRIFSSSYLKASKHFLCFSMYIECVWVSVLVLQSLKHTAAFIHWLLVRFTIPLYIAHTYKVCITVYVHCNPASEET